MSTLRLLWLRGIAGMEQDIRTEWTPMPTELWESVSRVLGAQRWRARLRRTCRRLRDLCKVESNSRRLAVIVLRLRRKYLRSHHPVLKPGFFGGIWLYADALGFRYSRRNAGPYPTDGIRGLQCITEYCFGRLRAFLRCHVPCCARHDPTDCPFFARLLATLLLDIAIVQSVRGTALSFHEPMLSAIVSLALTGFSTYEERRIVDEFRRTYRPIYHMLCLLAV